MRSRRLLLRLVVPAALVLLVASLAALQYRWLGQVSEAERDRRKTWLRQRAEEMSDDFDRELVRVYAGLQSASEPLTRNDVPGFVTRYNTWRETALDPQMIRAIYFLTAPEPANTQLKKLDVDRGVFDVVPWPDALAPMKKRTTPAPPPPVALRSSGTPSLPSGDAHAVFTSRDPLWPSVPAIVITLPVVRSVTTVGSGAFFTSMVGSPNELIVELDRDYIRTTMLPALVARYFPPRDADEYRFALIDPSKPASPIFARGVADNATLDPAHSDVTVPMFTLRLDLSPFIRQTTMATMTTRPGFAGTSGATRSSKDVITFGTVIPAPAPPAPPVPAGAGRAASPTNPRAVTGVANSAANLSIVVQARDADYLRVAQHVSGPAWQLVLQHTAGSLDAAVAQARRRNLWLSFSILAVLAAGVVLIVGNAQRSQRLAAQQMDFVATVSHELRTPLAVIRSAAQNLAAGVVSEPSQARRYGDLIESEGRRLTDMVEQVLEYAGLSGNRRPAMARPVDPAAVVEDIVAQSASLFDTERIQADVAIEPGLPIVLADEGALRRAISNLVGNAVKHAAEGRWVGITVRRGSTTGGKPEVQVAVADHGRGIDPDDLPHVFEPFYRGRRALDRQIHGNGLGLSLVKRIAEAHGGRITVKSAPGEGATFTMHLPAASPEPAPRPLSETASESGGTAG